VIHHPYHGGTVYKTGATMITLYTFGPAFGLTDASPFVTKALIQLKMSGQPFEVSTKGFPRAPKGKLPYIRDDGKIVADSTFIRWHLEEKYGVDFDPGLSSEQRAMAWAIEKLIEDNLYWIAVYWRWMDPANFRKVAEVFFKPVPKPLRGLVGVLMQRRFRRYLHAQGTGRHSEADMDRIGRRGLESVVALLGDKPYLMGQQPCGTDAILYASLAAVLCPHFESPLKQVALRHPTLAAYEQRMRQRFFAGPDAQFERRAA
jgi:glutathione S-transferase